MDDFYDSAPVPEGPQASGDNRISPAFILLVTLLLASFAIVITTRLLSR